MTVGRETMEDTAVLVKRVQEEFAKFEATMEELHLLRRVASDLRSYRKMIRLKRYD